MAADRPTIRCPRAWAALLALALMGAATTTRAHELWLSPSSYTPAPGSPVAVSASVGTGFRGEPKPYAAPRALRWELRAAKATDLRPLASHGDFVWARFAPPDAGGCLLQYESGFTSIELPAADFERYLVAEELDGPLATRRRSHEHDRPGRERYARCAKTWIAGGDASRATTPVGLTLEVVPLAPLRRGNLPVRVLFRGRPLAGALVRAWKQPIGNGGVPRDIAMRDSVPPVFAGRTDRSGLVTIDVNAPGEWLVGAVHMMPSDDKHEADWQSWWASLTFAPGEKR